MKVIREIARIHKPTVNEFKKNYVDRRIPVIISGGLDAWRIGQWAPSMLKEKLGSRKFTYRTELGRKEGVFADMMARIENASEENPAEYLRNIDLHHVFPELSVNAPTLPYMTNNWRNHWAWPANWPYHIRRDLTELFISGPGTSFPRLHIDYWGMDTFVAQLYGAKEFILYSPEDSANLYVDPEDPLVSTIDDFNNPNFAKYPNLAQTTQYRVLLKPGDLLYNPAWWHTTVTLDTSVTVIMAYYHRRNYPVFLNEIRRIYRNCNPYKTSLIFQYFSVVGWIQMWSDK